MALVGGKNVGPRPAAETLLRGEAHGEALGVQLEVQVGVQAGRRAIVALGCSVIVPGARIPAAIDLHHEPAFPGG